VVNLKEGLYANALLVDPEGIILVAARDSPEPVGPVTRRALSAALSGNQAVLSDFFSHADGAVYLDAAAMVPDEGGRPLALMILRSHAETDLYPLIQSWPTQSRSAEAMLLERQGQEVVVLNALRHRPKAALSLRIPLSQTDSLAVQAVLGIEGCFYGKDYRGVEVLADLRPVPGSPWFMAAKADAVEILEDVRYRARAVAIVVALFILLAAAITGFGYRQQQAGFFRGLYQLERLRREAEETFRSTFESIGDAVITTDTAGHVREMNPAASALTGWSRLEARGKPLEQVFRIVNEETRATADNPVQRALREGVVVGLANHTRLIARGGTERPIADSAAPIRTEDGGVTGVVLVFRDQTAEQAAQQALLDSEARLTFAMDTTRIGAWEHDLRDHTGHRTPIHDRIFGYESLLPEWSHEIFLQHVLPEDQPEVDRRFREAIANRAGWSFECRIRRADGEVRWIWAAGNHQLNPEGKAVRMAGVVQDITERKRHEDQLRKIAEELVRSNRELEQFAYISSHDLQEPLRMVTSFAGLLRDRYQGRLDATADQYIGFTIEGAQRMQALIAGLLDYSRVGKKENPRLLNAEEPLRAALANLKAAIESAGARVEVGPLPEVTVDPVQLTQVFQNLIGNAIKFHGAEPPRIRISAMRLDRGWQFSVQDNGIGIDPRHCDKIFEVFQRLHTQDQYSGTGIGLAICKKIVESHGGRIWVESKPGEGATFHFTIP
jgi:PAS domain S-box-containing protein